MKLNLSKLILSALIATAPVTMAACSDDDDNNPPGDGDGDTDTDTDSGDGDNDTDDTDTESGDGDTDTDDTDTESGDGDGVGGDGGGQGDGDGDGDDTDTEETGEPEPPPECEFEAEGLFCLDDCAAAGGPGDRVKDASVGAFLESKTWMDGWTNWSRDSSDVDEARPVPSTPNDCNFDGTNADVCTWLSEDIADDLTLTADKVWGLIGPVHVLDGVTLTIEPGTVIKGDGFSKGSLIVTRGAKIDAEGTADEPIVFTSLAANGDKAKGQWGGLIVLGKASNWKGGNVQIEGLADDPLNKYGADAVTDGSTDDDDSGTLKYVRIEFGGVEFATDQEINGLTLGSVGSETDISYIQVNTTLDDGIEWFGGTVDVDHIVVNNAGDDMVDIDQGYRGTIDTFFGRQVVPSTSDPNGFEWDSDKSAGDAGVGLLPATDVTFQNGTMCGTGKLGKPNYGMVLRENITGSIDNLAFMGFDIGIDTRDDFLVAGGDDPKVEITNSASWYQFDGVALDATDNDSSFDEAAWFDDENSNVNLDE